MTTELKINKIIFDYVSAADFRAAIGLAARVFAPDYCNDMNDMNEAMTVLYHAEPEKFDELGREVGRVKYAYKTEALITPAWQYAEAFVRVIGKWQKEFEDISTNRSWIKYTTKTFTNLGVSGSFLTGSLGNISLSGSYIPVVKNLSGGSIKTKPI
jgi:hypothetical protein